MFSVLLQLGPDVPAPEAIVRSLTALVPGVVQGHVRDVTIIADRPDQRVLSIADEAGCDVISDDHSALHHGIARAREQAILLLRAGALVDAACLDEMAQEVEAGLAHTAFILRARPQHFLERLFPQLALPVGILAQRAIWHSALSTDAGLRQCVKRMKRKHSLVSSVRLIGH
jgi:hypothetical protein